MDVVTFLTALYVTVDDFCQQHLPQEVQPGPKPSLSRSEVVTLAIFSQWNVFPSECAFYRYAHAHLRREFPRLPDRSQLGRLFRHHHDAIVAVGLSLAQQSAAYEALDTLPVTVRQYKRRGHGWLPEQADIGYSSRIAGWFCGFRLLISVSPEGVITGFGFGSASAKDQPLADVLLAARQQPTPHLPSAGQSCAGGLYLTDVGFESEARQQQWQAWGATVMQAPRSTSRHPWPRWLRRRLASLRQIVESVYVKLTHTFRLEQERPHELRGFSARLAGKVALHNFCIWLNRQLDRPLLAFAELISW